MNLEGVKIKVVISINRQLILEYEWTSRMLHISCDQVDSTKSFALHLIECHQRNKILRIRTLRTQLLDSSLQINVSFRSLLRFYEHYLHKKDWIDVHLKDSDVVELNSETSCISLVNSKTDRPRTIDSLECFFFGMSDEFEGILTLVCSQNMPCNRMQITNDLAW